MVPKTYFVYLAICFTVVVYASVVHSVPSGAILASFACLYILHREAKTKTSCIIKNVFEKKYFAIYLIFLLAHYGLSLWWPDSHLEFRFRGFCLLVLPFVAYTMFSMCKNLELPTRLGLGIALVSTGLAFWFVAAFGERASCPWLLLALLSGFWVVSRTYPNAYCSPKSSIVAFLNVIIIAPSISIWVIICIVLFFDKLAPKWMSGTLVIESVKSSADGDFIIANHRFRSLLRTTCFLKNGSMRELPLRNDITRWWQCSRAARYWQVHNLNSASGPKIIGINGESFSTQVKLGERVYAWTKEPLGFVCDGFKDEHYKLYYYDVAKKRLRCIESEQLSHRYRSQTSGNGQFVFLTSCNCDSYPSKKIGVFHAEFEKVRYISFLLEKAKSISFRGPGPDDACIVKLGTDDEKDTYMLFPDGRTRKLTNLDDGWLYLAPNGHSYILFDQPKQTLCQIKLGSWSAAEKRYIVVKEAKMGCRYWFHPSFNTFWSADSKLIGLKVGQKLFVFQRNGKRVPIRRRPPGELRFHGFWGSRWLLLEQYYGQVHLIDLIGNHDAILTEDGVIPPLEGKGTRTRSWLKGVL